MADTPDATAGELARVNENGTVDTGGREAWVWCEDEVTGHRSDFASRALPKKGIRVVEGYPLNFKRFGRKAKTRLELGGDPAETDVRGELPESEQPAPETRRSGDQHHHGADAAAAGPVDAPAPEVAPSGDAHHAAAVEATDDAAGVEAPAGGESEAAGDVAAAPTTKNRRAAR
jgi:hypothetical protein